MKKIILTLIFGLFLVSFVSAENNDNNSVPSLLSQIKEVLENIFDKLDIIAEKNSTVQVNIEPNITVNPPQVIVNPNITLTLPNKTCEWEKYNQDAIEPRKDNMILIPNKILYSEMRVVNASMNGICTQVSSPGYCILKVNNVECFSIHSSVWNTLAYYQIPVSCLNSFKSGINNVTLDGFSGLIKHVEELSLEMEIKPANC